MAMLTTVQAASIMVCVDRASICTMAWLSTKRAVPNFSSTTAFFPGKVILNLLILPLLKNKSANSELFCKLVNFSFHIVHMRIRVHK